MKEKDIVDFSKLKKDENDEYIDKNGEEIGCAICYTHSEAYKKLDTTGYTERIAAPLCPRCGKPMYRGYDGYLDAVVSEVNYSNPEGNIGYYPIFYCENCYSKETNHGIHHAYALMPVPILHNANHDIFYTGGKDYLIDVESNKLLNLIYEKIKPRIEEYITRVVDEKEKGLSMWNILLWSKRAIEHAIATWMYENNLKK